MVFFEFLMWFFFFLWPCQFWQTQHQQVLYSLSQQLMMTKTLKKCWTFNVLFSWFNGRECSDCIVGSWIDMWQWEEYIIRALVMSIPLFKSSSLCDCSQDESTVLVQLVFFSPTVQHLEKMTMGGNNTCGYVVTEVRGEALPSERNGSVVLCEGQRQPAAAHRDRLTNMHTLTALCSWVILLTLLPSLNHTVIHLCSKCVYVCAQRFRWTADL